MRKELPYFDLEGMCGGNQEIFTDLWMNVGGCAAVTACDVCIYCDLYQNTALYPYDLSKLTKQSYEQFSMIMKPYISPRKHGVSKLWMYTEGFSKYLEDTGCTKLQISEFDGHEDYLSAAETVRMQIDCGMPAAYLNLEHQNEALSDYVWHWFLITGYDDTDGNLLVKVVSYGGTVWFDFEDLWNSGFDEKGGMILFRINMDETAACNPGNARKCFEDDSFYKGSMKNTIRSDLEMAVERVPDQLEDSSRITFYQFCLRIVLQDLLAATESDILNASDDAEVQSLLSKDQKVIAEKYTEEKDRVLLINTLVVTAAFKKLGLAADAPETIRAETELRKQISALYDGNEPG